MEVKNLSKYFSEKILRRGYDYFKGGKVKAIYKSGNTYEALVKGTHEYKVTIDMTDDNYKLYCTCPYENHCKHEAAVLYCLKNGSLEIKEESFQDEINKLSPLEKFKRDLENKIISLNHKYEEYTDYDYYENETEMSEEEEEAEYDDFANTIKFYANRSISEFSNNKDQLIEAFKLLIDAIYNCNMNTYNYSATGLYSVLIKTYENLLESKDVFARILSTLIDLRTKEEEHFYKYIDDALCENIHNKWQAEYLVSYFSDLEKILKKSIFQKIQITYKFIDKEKAINEACKDKYSTDETVVDWLLDIYKDKQLKQIEILEKYCNNVDVWRFQNYYDKLLELYKKIDIEKYKNALLSYFYIKPTYDRYLKIKEALTNQEWLKNKKEVLAKAKYDTSLYCDICLKEKDYKIILDALNKNSIDFIIKYIEELITIYPKELFEIYIDKLIDFINNAKDTSSYKRVDNYFNYLLKFPNGRNEVLKLIDYINVNFPTRRAFQSEMEFYKDTYL